MRPFLAVLTGVLLLVGSFAPAGEKAKTDKGKEKSPLAGKLEGQWKIVAGEKSGAKLDAKKLGELQVAIAKNVLTLEGKDGKFVMKFTLDAKKKPVGIDWEITESPFGPGAKAKGILALEKDTLKLCYHPENGKAPTAFTTSKESGTHLFVMKKVK